MKITLKRTITMIAVGLAMLSISHGSTLDPYAFTRQMPVTFSGYAGGVPLTNFPVLVKLSTDISGFSYAEFAENGVNLRFADSSDESLSYEIDTWNTNGTSLVWVRVPELTASTTIKAYWGANYIDHALSQTNGTAWTGGAYVGVWHLNETGETFADSTANNLTGTNYSTTTTSSGKLGAARQISNGAQADKDGKGIEIPNYNSFNVGNTFTVSTWFKHKAQMPGHDRIVSRKAEYDNPNGFEFMLRDNSKTEFTQRGTGTDAQTTGVFTDVTDGQWCFLNVIYDGTTHYVYVNGVLKKTTPGKSAATDNGQKLMFGNNRTRNEFTFKGVLDEIRLRDSISSGDWIAAEYKNVNDNAAFASYGTVQTIVSPYPLLLASDVVSTTFHSADLVYTLEKLGNSNPDIKVAYGTVSGQLNTTSLIASATSALGTYTNTLSGLLCNTTYFFRHLASNASGTSQSPEIAFKTPGEPLLGPAMIEATGYTLDITGSLTDIGVANTTVELWHGTAPESLSVVKTWADLSSPQALSETLTSQPSGAHYAKFRAYNVCTGVTNETWTTLVNDTIFGASTWTGAASDSDFNNPANWSSGTVPGYSDTATFTSAGLTNNEVIKLSANQIVKKLVLDTITSFKIGDTNDVAASYSLTLTDFDRLDNVGIEGTNTFGASVKLTSDGSGSSTWTINGSGLVSMEGVLGTNAANAATTFVKLGTGTLDMNFASPTFDGLWKIIEGTVTASQPSSIRGNPEVGGTVVPASLTLSENSPVQLSPNSGMHITILTNGTLTAAAMSGSRVGSVRVKEGGVATIGGDANEGFNSRQAYLTGGLINGYAFTSGGFDQKIVTYASALTAVMNLNFQMGTYFNYDSTIDVADGTAVVDFDMRGSLLGAGTGGAILTRSGAGTAVFAKASTYINNISTNVGWKFTGGRSIFTNATGSAVGKNRTQVNGGATIGGTGFFGGDSAYTNFTVLVQGGATNSLAVVAPGSIDLITGESLAGTLTVGSATAPNAVTFSTHSLLDMQIGKNGAADQLKVYGTVDLSSTTDNLKLTVDPEAKPGVYTLVSASDGITGTFNTLTAGFPKPNQLSYTATTVDYRVLDRATMLLLR